MQSSTNQILDFNKLEAMLKGVRPNYVPIATNTEIEAAFGKATKIKDLSLRKDKIVNQIQTNVLEIGQYILGLNSPTRQQEDNIFALFNAPGYLNHAENVNVATKLKLGLHYIDQVDKSIKEKGLELLMAAEKELFQFYRLHQKLDSRSIALWANLGKFYYKEKNYKKAFKFLEDAALYKNPVAQTFLGGIYYFGRGVEKDSVRALKLLEESAKQGEFEAKKFLGQIYYHGTVTAPDFSKSYQYLSSLRLEEQEGIKFYLADMYYTGRGVAQDYSKAHQYFVDAADEGDLRACILLVEIYYEGKGEIKANIDKAIEYLEKIAKTGDVEAQHYIAMMYQEKGDNEKAYAYYLQAANKGFAPSMLALFQYHLEQPTNEQIDKKTNNTYEAAAWLEFLATSDEPSAQQLLEDHVLASEEAIFEQIDQIINNVELTIDSSDELSSASLSKNFSIRTTKRETKIAERSKKMAVIRARHQENIQLATINEQTEENVLRRKNRLIAEKIFAGDTKLSVIDFYKLFRDPLFKNQVTVSKTADGFKIEGQTSKIISTHRPHNGKDIDPNFLKDLERFLRAFVK